MSLFENTFSLNTYTYPYIASFAVLLLSSLFTLLNYLLFSRRKEMLHSFIILLITEAFLLSAFLLFNSKTPNSIYRFSQLFYLVLFLLYNGSVHTISALTKRPNTYIKLFGLTGLIIVTFMIYASDQWIITRELLSTAYNKTAKGPYFPLLMIYILILTTFMIIDFYRFYKKDFENFKQLWPLHVGVLGFSFYMLTISVIIYLRPLATPHIFIPALFYNVMVTLYVFRQIRKNINDHDLLYHKYLFDPLTGVHTRDYLFNTINSTLSKRLPDEAFIAMIDIDGFKTINDTYGHLIGDQVLKIFGNLLNALPTTYYTAGRLGGDEFMLLIIGRSFHKVEMDLKDLIVHYTVELTKLDIDVLKTKTGLSIGLTPLKSTLSLEENAYRADQIMYDAKKAGKNNLIHEA